MAAINDWGTNPRDYMTGVLRIPLSAVGAILEEGGFETFQDFVTVEDTQIIYMVKNCRKLPGPAVARARARGAGAAREDGAATDRLRVSDLACTKVRQLAFYCFHLDRINRPFVAAGATLARLQTLWVW